MGGGLREGVGSTGRAGFWYLSFSPPALGPHNTGFPVQP